MRHPMTSMHIATGIACSQMPIHEADLAVQSEAVNLHRGSVQHWGQVQPILFVQAHYGLPQQC